MTIGIPKASPLAEITLLPPITVCPLPIPRSPDIDKTGFPVSPETR